MARLRRTVASVASLLIVLLWAAPAGAATSWPTYHADNARDGVDSTDVLTPLRTAWTDGLDGAAVYGQPVVADGRVFVATEDDDVYALDAHDGRVLWSHNIGTPLTGVGHYVGCGDIDPLGITSTPVVDLARGQVYVVGEVLTGAGVKHVLEGFDVYSGARSLSVDADPALPSGETAVDLKYLQQRAALTLANGRIYVSYGGLDGDCGDYHGWVVGVDEGGVRPTVQFDTTPTGHEGAVWESGGGPAVDAAGNLYVTTGNPAGSPAIPYADGLVKLSPSLAVEAYFHDPAANPGADEDFGTGNAVLLPGNLLFAVGKSDVGYVLRQSDLSQVAALSGVCSTNPDGGPVFDSSTDSVYVPCRGAGIRQVKLSGYQLGWGPSGPQGSPIVVHGQLWAVQYGSNTMQELDATTGAVIGSTVTLPRSTPTFASPSAALGLLLVGLDGGVAAYAGPAGPPPPAPPAPPATAGYDLVAADGGVFSYGNAVFHGSLGGHPLAAPVVGAAATPDGGGYWLVASDGGVFAYGDARFYGSMGGHHLNAPVVGMAAAAGGDGYWLVASDGGVFAFGPGAVFQGSMGAVHLARPVVSISADAATGGYWLVAADGGVFNFGAPFYGSLGNIHLAAPVVGSAAAHGGDGYWMVASDGGVFALGPGAAFHGSAAATGVASPAVSIAGDSASGGYWVTTAAGDVYALGAPFEGSASAHPLARPVVAITSAS